MLQQRRWQPGVGQQWGGGTGPTSLGGTSVATVPTRGGGGGAMSALDVVPGGAVAVVRRW